MRPDRSRQTAPSGGTEAAVEAYIERQQERLPGGVGYSFAIADADTDEAVEGLLRR